MALQLGKGVISVWSCIEMEETHQAKAKTVKVNDGHGVWMGLALLRRPALWYSDEVLDVTIPILRERQSSYSSSQDARTKPIP